MLIGAVVPFTVIGILPTNHKLFAPGRDLGSTETRMLLERWGSLHAVRTTLSVLATVLYIWSFTRSLIRDDASLAKRRICKWLEE